VYRCMDASSLFACVLFCFYLPCSVCPSFAGDKGVKHTYLLRCLSFCLLIDC